jgi:hypothetical protein
MYILHGLKAAKTAVPHFEICITKDLNIDTNLS